MGFLKRNWRQLDLTLIISVVLLTTLSCLVIFAATYGKSGPQIPSHAWLKQCIFSGIGFVVMLVTAAIDYRELKKFHWWIYGVALFLLVGVFAFHPINGARSWIPLPGFSLQPSELMKIAIVVTLSSLMSTSDSGVSNKFLRHALLWGIVVTPFLLTWKEPALGQAVIMFAIFCTMYVVAAPHRWFVAGTMVFITISVFMIATPLMFPVQATHFVENVLMKHHILHGYQADRILTWLDPTYKLQSAGYEIAHVQTAIASGETYGEGWLHGVETNTGSIPNQWNDYIFSTVGEEFGLIGSGVLILLFLVLIHRLVRVASFTQDAFGSLIITGVVTMLGFQVFENIGMDLYMSPSTGITLPFVSYGGSALVVDFLCIGMVLSVLLRHKRTRIYGLVDNETVYTQIQA